MTNEVIFTELRQQIVDLLTAGEHSLADLAFEIYGKRPKVADPQNNIRANLSLIRGTLRDAGDNRIVQTIRKPGTKEVRYRIVRVSKA